MKITLRASDPFKQPLDVLVLFGFSDSWEEEIKKLQAPLAKSVREQADREKFKAGLNETLTVFSKGDTGAYKLLIYGCGKKSGFSLSKVMEQTAKAVRYLIENKAVNVGFSLNDAFLKQFDTAKCIQAITEAINLSSYKFRKYKSIEPEKENRALEEASLFLPASKIASAETGVASGQITSTATLYARDLVNEPSQITTPTFLASEAITIAKNSKGKVKVEIIEKEQAYKMGMNAFLGVSRGSDEPPKFIILRYKNRSAKKKITIIGKGITFDTGGLSLKPSGAMETMKLDMAGAASILGVFSAISEYDADVELTGIIAACENMPSGRALKPGDILKAYNGKTIEVLNTDAEGRLTLADALSYTVAKIKPDEIIDLATLTGACMVALGQDIAGIFSNNEKLMSNLEKSAAETNEKIWPLPLPEEYKELNKSHIADIKNIGNGRYAGAITAALFLQEFVSGVSWAHLDIAGPAFMEKDTILSPYGGSGFGVRLILHYLNTL